MSADMLEDIHDGSQSCPSISSIDSRYKICDSFKKRQAGCKGELLSM